MTKTHKNYPWLKTYNKGLGVEWDIDIPSKPAFSMLDEAAARYASHPAFDFLGKIYTWAEIGSLVDKFAAGLQKSGIKKGDKIGLFLPNTPYYLIAYYGVLKTGASVVNFNPLYAERELAHHLGRGGDFATAFADGQLVADRALANFDLTRSKRAGIRLGAGVWGGAQKGSERLDIGPSANILVPVADAPVRLSLDYRIRAAGDAEPGSGVALTLSTGF